MKRYEICSLLHDLQSHVYVLLEEARAVEIGLVVGVGSETADYKAEKSRELVVAAVDETYSHLKKNYKPQRGCVCRAGQTSCDLPEYWMIH